jgi:hypothetical protein
VGSSYSLQLPKIVGWVARSKTQHQHTSSLEMLGFILQPNLPY